MPSCFSLDQVGAVLRGLKFAVLGEVVMKWMFGFDSSVVKVLVWVPLERDSARVVLVDGQWEKRMEYGTSMLGVGDFGTGIKDGFAFCCSL